MKHDERRLHIAMSDWLNLALPEGCEVSHFPAGEHRTKKTGALLKRMGLKPGWPDFIGIWNGKPFGIEVKTEDGNGLSGSQEEMLPRLVRAGMTICVATKLEDAEAFLRFLGIPLKAKVKEQARAA